MWGHMGYTITPSAHACIRGWAIYSAVLGVLRSLRILTLPNRTEHRSNGLLHSIGNLLGEEWDFLTTSEAVILFTEPIIQVQPHLQYMVYRKISCICVRVQFIQSVPKFCEYRLVRMNNNNVINNVNVKVSFVVCIRHGSPNMTDTKMNAHQ